MASDSSHPSSALVAALQGGLGFEFFNPQMVNPFVEQSVSEETRRAHCRVVMEFFRFIYVRHLAQVTPADVQQSRDRLLKAKKNPATAYLKLSVIHSLFDYLKAGGYVSANPALTRLAPPAVSEDLQRKAKGDQKRTLPLSPEVKQTIDHYLKANRSRRPRLRGDGLESYIFQPITNNHALIFNKPLSTTGLTGRFTSRVQSIILTILRHGKSSKGFHAMKQWC